MGDNINNAIATDQKMIINGKEYLFRKATVDDFSQLTEHIRARRVKLILDQTAKMPGEQRAALVNAVVSESINVDKEADSFEGLQFILHRCVKADMTYEEFGKMILMEELPLLMAQLKDTGADESPPDQEPKASDGN